MVLSICWYLVTSQSNENNIRKKYLLIPERIAGPPKTNNGKGCQTFANGAINGASKHPTLEIVEQDPTVVGFFYEFINLTQILSAEPS